MHWGLYSEESEVSVYTALSTLNTCTGKKGLNTRPSRGLGPAHQAENVTGESPALQQRHWCKRQGRTNPVLYHWAASAYTEKQTIRQLSTVPLSHICLYRKVDNTWNDWWLQLEERPKYSLKTLCTQPPPPPADNEQRPNSWSLIGGIKSTFTVLFL